MKTPGTYLDIPEEDYHRDADSLSVTGAKTLLKAPALFVYEQEHPVFKDVYEFGSLVHREVLGDGPEVVLITATSAKKADQAAHKEGKEAARAANKIPATEKQIETARAMAEALRKNEDAAELLTAGKAEVSAYWVDEATGVNRRCRFDFLPDLVDGQRLTIIDYKTAPDASPERWAKDAADFSYEMQYAWYVDAALALGLDPDPTLAFIVQEKTAPYLASVIRLDADALQLGRWRNRKALDLYAECKANNHWPGYTNNLDLPLPAWHLIKNSEAFA